MDYIFVFMEKYFLSIGKGQMLWLLWQPPSRFDHFDSEAFWLHLGSDSHTNIQRELLKLLNLTNCNRK